LPWRIVDIVSGCVVEDATGVQLGVFYGPIAPNNAGHTGFLTIDEARQMAIDFARMPELVGRQPLGNGSDRDEDTDAASERDVVTAALECGSVTIEIAMVGNRHTAAVFRGRAELRILVANTRQALA
jgi:hypothetical protein